MKTKRNLSVLAILSFMFFVFGCGEELGGGSSDNHRSSCPTSSETAKLEDPFAYGKFIQGKYDDDEAWRQVDTCGWSIYNEHRGGYGHTLQIIKDSVILVWAYDTFNGFILGPGWNGQTDKGLMLGDSLWDLFEVYPEASRNVFYPKHWVYSSDNSKARFFFNNRGRLEAIDVGFGRYDYFKSDEVIDPDYVDVTGSALPGQWTGTIVNPGYERVYSVYVPSHIQTRAFSYNYIKINIQVAAKGLYPVCLETQKTFDNKKVGESTFVCAPDHISYGVHLRTDFNERYEKWEFEDLAILVSGQGNATGSYEISIECPSGSIQSFCNPEYK